MQLWSKLRQFARLRWLELILAAGLISLLSWYAVLGYGFLPKPLPTPTPLVGQFDGLAAYGHVLAQMAFGPRDTGSPGNARTRQYIVDQLTQQGWQAEVQEFIYQGTAGQNIVGKAGAGPVILVGAHYDTRRRADNDPNPERRNDPVPGANDGASGVAILLELARSLDKTKLSNEVWLTFFDAEDNGRLDGWDFIVGSRYMASNLVVTPTAVIIVDMVGDTDQQLFKERNSAPELQNELWAIAEELGLGEYFIDEYKWAMIDDHTPFLQLGIPAVDIIDFDYPYWHTTEDTADKVAAESLARVGRVLKAFLETR